jgi:peptidoglycan/xylan/chitin deacetylase (PgdA/CDA1 family)
MWRANTSDKVMALSFDDGPGTSLTAPLLDVLRDEQVRATFCLVGRRAFERRELVVRQMRDGHELVNHTWSHADLSLLEYDAAKQELERTDQLLSEITGRAPRLIRPPYGRIDGALLQYAARAHQHILLWDLRFHEAQFDPAGNVEYVLENMRPGSVLLGHDAGSKDRYVGIRAVPEVIREAKRRGYEFLTASEMFARDSEQELRQPPSP